MMSSKFFNLRKSLVEFYLGIIVKQLLVLTVAVAVDNLDG